MNPDDIPNMNPDPDVGADALWVAALVMLILALVSVFLFVWPDMYRECREHGFSVAYCLWK